MMLARYNITVISGGERGKAEAAAAMIQFFLLVSRQGKCRCACVYIGVISGCARTRVRLLRMLEFALTCA